MNGIDLTLIFHFYVDASGFAGGLAITQRQLICLRNKEKTPKDGYEEVPVIYDSFAFNKAQRAYPTYKRELCFMVTFAKKYDYLCKPPNNTTIIHTDHRPLIHSQKSDAHEGLYGNWADILRRINIHIRHIPGTRNKAADGLSRTIFRSESCETDDKIKEALKILNKEGPKWVWKDGPGGYEHFLASLNEGDSKEVRNNGTLNGVSVFPLEINPYTSLEKESWKEAYERSDWFGAYYLYLDQGILPKESAGRVIEKALNHRLDPDTRLLWIHHRNR